jgi:hypothetical protein
MPWVSISRARRAPSTRTMRGVTDPANSRAPDVKRPVVVTNTPLAGLLEELWFAIVQVLKQLGLNFGVEGGHGVGGLFQGSGLQPRCGLLTGYVEQVARRPVHPVVEATLSTGDGCLALLGGQAQGVSHPHHHPATA